MKTSKQTQLVEIQTGCVVTPVEKAVEIQQLGALKAQPNKAGLVQHLDMISALLSKDVK